MNNIELLQKKISQAFSDNVRNDAFGKPVLMTEALAAVKLAFDTPKSDISSHSIISTLLEYRKTGELNTFVDVKYVCFGVGLQIESQNWCLLNDLSVLLNLLALVDKYAGQPRRFKICYEGLLSAYFHYPCNSNKISKRDRANWESLRTFLSIKLPVALSSTLEGSWLHTLKEHNNLLEANPCERYKDKLLLNDYSELKDVCNTLGILNDSWVWEEAIISHIKAACGLSDKDYKSHLQSLIKVVIDKKTSPIIAIKSISLLLIRYLKCTEKEVHPELRDSSVRIIGNPWLNRAAWDAQVRNDDARKMVDGWLKQKLIFDFFSLLSEDGAVDKRRLTYWLRYHSEISDMWFALGPNARNNTSADFKQFKVRANGRLINLENAGSAENNAFILCLGDWVVVEFGCKGNACYIYQNDKFPFELGSRNWVHGYNDLRSKHFGEQFIHSYNWEEKMDNILSRRLAWTPSDIAYNSVTNFNANQRVVQEVDHHYSAVKQTLFDEAIFQTFVKRNNFVVSDLRHKNGALWVRTQNNDTGINKMLENFGFTYKNGRGWWKE